MTRQISAQEIAKDLIAVNNGERSVFYESLPGNEVFSYAKNGYALSHEQTHFSRNAIYVVEAIRMLGPSLPQAVKQVEKAGAGLNSAAPIRRLVDKALIGAIIANGTNPSRHLLLMLDLIKNQPERLNALRVDGLNHLTLWSGNELVERLAQRMKDENAPAQSWAMLAVLKDCENPVEDMIKGVSPSRADDLVSRRLFGAMHDEEISQDVRSAMDCIRLLSRKPKNIGHNMAFLCALDLAHGSSQSLSQSREVAALQSKLIIECGGLDVLVRLCISATFKALLSNNPVDENHYLHSSASLIKQLSRAVSKTQLDELLVVALSTQSRKMNRRSIDEIGLNKMIELSRVYATVAGNWQACLWSILSGNQSTNEYMNLSKSKTVLLRKAIDVIDKPHVYGDIRLMWARVALIESYNEKLIGLIMHNKKDSGEILRKLYAVVGDRNILPKMDGQSRKASIMSEMDL